MEPRYTVFAVFVIAATSTALGAIVNHPVTATGRVRCKLDGYFQPVPYVKVYLLDVEFANFVTRLGVTTTNAWGYFVVSGSGRDGFSGTPDPQIRVEYVYNSTYGRLEVEGTLRNRRNESPEVPYNETVDFGNLDFDNPHCRAYIRFYNVLKEYYALTGETPPYSALHVKTNFLIHAGTPFATLKTVHIPKSWDPLSFGVARHEFAHTIRHSYDGNFNHFLLDVVRFGYTRYHYCSSKTNLGFAFNEGWAEYYAGDCGGELCT